MDGRIKLKASEENMQISRHWRMNANRYRLEGFTLPSGEKALQPRQAAKSEADKPAASEPRKTQEQSAALTAA